MTEQLVRITGFLRQYVQQPDGKPLPPTQAHIICGIKVLIEDGIMTAEDIRFEALRDFDVFIPDNFFPKEGE